MDKATKDRLKNLRDRRESLTAEERLELETAEENEKRDQEETTTK